MEIKIGTKINKPLSNYGYYSQIAQWCNKNNAHIEDKDKYYEVVENIPYTPTIPEQIAELERQIEQINTKMLRDMIILQDENATEQAKQEAQTYFNNKVAQRAELIEQINQLKNNDEE